MEYDTPSTSTGASARRCGNRTKYTVSKRRIPAAHTLHQRPTVMEGLLLSAFETMARTNPMRVCFAAVDADGHDVPYGYQQTRLMSAAIAWRLQEFGARKGSYVMVDLPNIAIYPLLVLAGAYGGFGLVLMDYQLPPQEKEARKLVFSRDLGDDLVFCIDKTNVLPLMRWAIDFLAGKHEVRTQEEGSLGANLTQRTMGGKSPNGRAGSFRFSGGGQIARGNSGANRANQSKNAQDTCVHFAERQGHLFNLNAPAFIFTATDARGRMRAVCHSWRSILANTQAANEALAADRMAVWQCVLPLWTVEGMQVVLRGLAGCNSFVLYRRFDANQVLKDVRRYRVTHIAVDTQRLAKLLDVGSAEFAQYACVLVDCGKAARRSDVRIFKAARRASNHVRLAYGTAETAGMVAVEDDLVEDEGGNGMVCAMRPLSGCDLQVSNPDGQGFGALSVRTAGMFDGYLDGQSPRMRNGFFITGDEAALYRERLYLR